MCVWWKKKETKETLISDGICDISSHTDIVIAAFACCTSVSFSVSHTYTHLFSSVCKVEPRGLIARRVTEVAQSTLDMVTTAVDYPLCECSCILPLHTALLLDAYLSPGQMAFDQSDDY